MKKYLKFNESDALCLETISHINGHISYLLTCDSKAKDGIEGLAENNIIAYYQDGILVLENNFDLKRRTALAKEIRKKAKESLKNLNEKTIQDNLRMELAYLDGLTEYNMTTDEGFNEMANFVARYIQENEHETKKFGEESFLYVFHVHQNSCPHLHRFFKVDR